jgi:hypothetical protein
MALLTYHGCLINFLENNVFESHGIHNRNNLNLENIGLNNYFTCPI